MGDELEKRLVALEEQIAFQQAMLSAAGQAIIATNLSGSVVYMNSAAEDLYHWSAAEALGRNIMELNVPEISIAQAEEIMDQLRSGQSWRGEFLVQRRDGTTFHASVVNTPIMSAAGELTGIIGLSSDISAQKRIEESMARENEIQNAEAALRLAIASMDEPSDIAHVVKKITEQLHLLDIEHDSCSVQIIDPQGADFVSIGSGCGPDWEYEVMGILNGSYSPGNGVVYPWVIDVWKMGVPRLEPCISIAKTNLVDISLIDVPFSHGTLAINLRRHHALGKEEMALLQRFASVLSEGFQRFLDIVERKKVETALRDSEGRYRALFEQAADAVVLVDVESGAIVDCNDRAHETLGYSRAEFLRLRVADFEAIESNSTVERHIQHIIDQGGDTFYTRHRTRSGETLDVQVSARVIELDGRSHIQSIMRDVGVQKKLERQLQQSNFFLNQSQEIAQIGSWSWNLRTNEARWSDQLYRIYGRDPAQGPPDIETWQDHIHPEDVEPLSAAMQAAIDSGQRYKLDYRLRRYDNEQERIAHAETDITTDNMGERWMLGTVQDVTDQRRIEEELRKANNLQSLGVLAGGIAHDFNNMLTGVLGNLSLLERLLVDNAALCEIATDARVAAERTRGLTGQLLTFARGGAPVRKWSKIDRLVRETVEMSLHGSNVRADFHLAADLDSAYIDLGQIGQVLQNLVINADQAMPNGGAIKIGGENVDIGAGDALPLAPGRYIKLWVEDEGVGIPASIIARIFDPYFTTKNMGNGIGLAISHSIITRHGGHIDVRSQLNVGSTFTLYLPASAAPILNEYAAPPGELEERGERVVSSDKEERIKSAKPLALGQHSGRILLMDDEELIHTSIGRVLRALGCEVEHAYNGDEALKLHAAGAKNNAFDMVIVDLTVPGGRGGKEIVAELKQVDPQVHVVVASGYAADPVLADYAAYGFAGCLAKPVDFGELSQLVQDLLDKRESDTV